MTLVTSNLPRVGSIFGNLDVRRAIMRQVSSEASVRSLANLSSATLVHALVAEASNFLLVLGYFALDALE